MKLSHPALARLLQRAYSGEKAAALAYIGHAGSLRGAEAKAAVKQIEEDEWQHRRNVLSLMERYEVPIDGWLEFRCYCVGKLIAASCYVIGRFMPYFFAGKLESGNVCEYFVMMRHFQSLGIREHDEMLYEMGIKEKEHEAYFLSQIEGCTWLPWFERVFAWGQKHSANNVDLAAPVPVAESHQYCKTYQSKE